MDRILVFHQAEKVYGVVRITNYRLLKAIKADAASGMGFDELMFKHKLKQCEGEEIEVKGE